MRGRGLAQAKGKSRAGIAKAASGSPASAGPVPPRLGPGEFRERGSGLTNETGFAVPLRNPMVGRVPVGGGSQVFRQGCRGDSPRCKQGCWGGCGQCGLSWGRTQPPSFSSPRSRGILRGRCRRRTSRSCAAVAAFQSVADVDALEGGEPACARSRRSPAASPAQYPARRARGERWRLGAAPAQTAPPTAAPASLLATGSRPGSPAEDLTPAADRHAATMGLRRNREASLFVYPLPSLAKLARSEARWDGPGAGRAPARRLRDPRPRLALGLLQDRAPAHLLSACQGG